MGTDVVFAGSALYWVQSFSYNDYNPGVFSVDLASSPDGTPLVLTPGTTHYYRAFVYGSDGWTWGEETKFSTPGTVGVECGADIFGHCWASAVGFCDTLSNFGWNPHFAFDHLNAWERDFKQTGDDAIWADSVDIVWFEGHGESGLIKFDVQDKDDPQLEYWEAKWGDGQLDWVFLMACLTLQDEPSPNNVLKSSGKFGQSLNGARMILGACTPIMSTGFDGPEVATYLTVGKYGSGPQPVWLAWARGLAEHQLSTDCIGFVAEDISCTNDYIWGVESGPSQFPGVDDYYCCVKWQVGTFAP